MSSKNITLSCSSAFKKIVKPLRRLTSIFHIFYSHTDFRPSRTALGTTRLPQRLRDETDQNGEDLNEHYSDVQDQASNEVYEESDEEVSAVTEDQELTVCEESDEEESALTETPTRTTASSSTSLSSTKSHGVVEYNSSYYHHHHSSLSD